MRAAVERPRFREFGTKAETLLRLKPMVRQARIPEIHVFDVRQWLDDPSAVVGGIAARFANQSVVVRSSAVGEDGAHASMAGAFVSRLGVDAGDAGEIESAVREVIGSYAGDERDQVLVQPMISGVAMSGVVMTHDLGDGAPYYVINYDDESGRTDTITGGTGVNKTVHLYRDLDPAAIGSERIALVLRMVRELEEICGGVPLDIEFTVTASGELHLLQVRRISVTGQWSESVVRDVADRLPAIEAFLDARSLPRPGIAGRRTILGVMPDWNPAEIIGTTPGALAISLYRELITKSAWREARADMGYRPLGAEELMVVLAGRPYIDVRNSFNSLLPAGLPEPLAGEVVDAWLDRLDRHPELHDKVEFEVAQTCLDLTFDEVLRSRYGSIGDARGFRESVRILTREALRLDAGGSLPRAEARVAQLARWQSLRARPWASGAALQLVAGAASLLEECREYGTRPFSVLARHAFIAESLLRSAVQVGILAPERLALFRRSVRTVSGDFVDALRLLERGELAPDAFLARFGHLRPGTYDIQSLTYADRPEILGNRMPESHDDAEAPFAPTPAERRGLERALDAAGLEGVSPEGLLEHARRAIAGREYAKFVFTRNLSDALELLARWGEGHGFDREALSHISWTDLQDGLAFTLRARELDHFAELVERGRQQVALARAIKLGFLLREPRDLYVVPQHRSLPNFLSSGHVAGPVVFVDAHTSSDVELRGRIVCIENADPGYDWIFGHGIGGLITQYGGTNSHMAIRCAEFGLPAAIGCGPQLFGRIVAAGSVDLNCGEKALRPLHEH